MLRYLMLVAGLSLVTAAKFPSYIRKCARDDPAFSKCALASARAAKDNILRGDRGFRLQSMDPLVLSEIRVEQAGRTGLNITLSDIKVTGLADLEFTDNFNWDLDKQLISYELKAPRIELNSDYEMQGQILILPITGKGRANVTLLTVDVRVKSPYNKVTRANGKEYLSLLESEMIMEPKKAFFNFSNLFNGDPLLGPQTNLFINENWQLLIDDLGPTFSMGVSAAVVQNIQAFLDKIPFDELIPKKVPA